jgi:hypothetical protein
VIVFKHNDHDGCFEPKGSGPRDERCKEIARNQKWSNRFDEIDRDLQVKQILDSLETEDTGLVRTCFVSLTR